MNIRWCIFTSQINEAVGWIAKGLQLYLLLWLWEEGCLLLEITKLNILIRLLLKRHLLLLWRSIQLCKDNRICIIHLRKGILRTWKDCFTKLLQISWILTAKGQTLSLWTAQKSSRCHQLKTLLFFAFGYHYFQFCIKL